MALVTAKTIDEGEKKHEGEKKTGDKTVDKEKKDKASKIDGKTGDKTVDKEKKKKERTKPRDRETLATGQLVHNPTSNITWQIQAILGAGGFGDVYRVGKQGDQPKPGAVDPPEYAMKTELAAGERSMLRLKVEAEAMLVCNKAKNRKHFVEIVDRGKAEKFKFVVMTLVGANLDSYRKQVNGDFSISTSMQIAIQTMEAIRDFHQAGWMHRDIKPHNFAYGVGDKMPIIYILDFGIARRIFDKNKKIKVQRIYVKFLGTMRYASRRCHKCLEQGRKDDVETWVYMMFDIFDRNKGLPWRKETDKKAVAAQKELFWKKEHKETFHAYYEAHCPILREFYLIVENVRGLMYEDEPAYNQIIDHLVVTSKKKRIDLQLPLDWTKKEMMPMDKIIPGEVKEPIETAKPQAPVEGDKGTSNMASKINNKECSS